MLVQCQPAGRLMVHPLAGCVVPPPPLPFLSRFLLRKPTETLSALLTLKSTLRLTLNTNASQPAAASSSHTLCCLSPACLPTCLLVLAVLPADDIILQYSITLGCFWSVSCKVARKCCRRTRPTIAVAAMNMHAAMAAVVVGARVES